MTESNPTLPEAKDGLIPTLNQMGWMTTGLDVYSRAFVDFAAQAPGSALDIGAAYGVASLAALKTGAKVIANDIDARHLDILYENASTDAGNLTLLPGSFPDGIDLPNGSVGAILVCRVLHFFDGTTIERGIEKMFNWLAKGGKIFAVGETPYLGNMRGFIPLYEERLKDPNCAWPGYFDNVQEICDPAVRDKLPPMINFFDLKALTRAFKAAGFTIENTGTFARPEYPAWAQYDGRESAGIIARK